MMDNTPADLTAVHSDPAKTRATIFWSSDENQRFIKAIRKYGDDFDKITEAVGTRKRSQVVHHVKSLQAKA